jgi:hypothetical protein
MQIRLRMTIWIFGLALLPIQFGCRDVSPSRNVAQNPSLDSQFEKPVRIKAGDEFVAVESLGYACPTLADVDGDGLEDLIVGQFSQGHMQFYKNIGKQGNAPEFAASEWIKTGDERAVVPGVL